MDADMIDLDRERICYADAEHLADLWNAAYPLMRSILTVRIDGLRRDIDRKVWESASPSVEVHPEFRTSEARIRRRLDALKNLRLELGQLDRGEHRPCTQSPKCYSIVAAHSRVTSAVREASSAEENMASVYRLAAFLAERHDSWLKRMRER